MTVPTSLVSRPIALAPLVTRHSAPSRVSHPHVVSCPGQANGSSNSSFMPLPSHSADAASHFHVVSHVARPYVTPYPVRSSASSAPSPTRSTSHSNVDISHAAPSSPPQVASHVPPPHVASRPEQASGSSRSSSTPPPSRSMAHPTAAGSLPPRRKRSRRCFVCGGTGKHRLNPRFCPRTYELLSKHLATFDATFRLVSYDGSPLPMTRHPGGVAAHLLSPRRFLPRTARASPRSPSTSASTSKSNPPHVPHVPRDPPVRVPCRVPDAVPIANLNRPHLSHSPVEPPLRISSPDHRTSKSNPPHVVFPATVPLRTVEPSSDSNRPHVAVAASVRPRTVDPNVDLNPPHASHPSAILPRPISGLDRSVESSLLHFPPVERLPSPPIYLPIRIPHPDLNPSADHPHDDSSPHVTLSIFEILFISPSVRTELRELIDTLDRGKVGYEWPTTPALRKVFYRILDRIVDSLSSPP